MALLSKGKMEGDETEKVMTKDPAPEGDSSMPSDRDGSRVSSPSSSENQGEETSKDDPDLESSTSQAEPNAQSPRPRSVSEVVQRTPVEALLVLAQSPSVQGLAAAAALASEQVQLDTGDVLNKTAMTKPMLTSYEALDATLQAGRSEPSSTAAQTSGETTLPQQKAAATPSTDASGPPKVISMRSLPKNGKSKQGSLRRGKWTVEEEAYVARVIQDFNSGFLDAPAGTTLRTYLSNKLKCDPMRITKKFTGEACIGKRVFHPAVRSPSNAAAIDRAQSELDALERRWRRRLEMQQRESAKKAAASAAVAAVASPGRTHGGSDEFDDDSARNPVAQTASWLDRAKSALQDQSEGTSAKAQTPDLRHQMNEVKQLIHEGPVIQQTSADLPQMLDNPEGETSASVDLDEEPADKRLRTTEDAEALVGFFQKIRSSAAAGEQF